MYSVFFFTQNLRENKSTKVSKSSILLPMLYLLVWNPFLFHLFTGIFHFLLMFPTCIQLGPILVYKPMNDGNHGSRVCAFDLGPFLSPIQVINQKKKSKPDGKCHGINKFEEKYIDFSEMYKNCIDLSSSLKSYIILLISIFHQEYNRNSLMPKIRFLNKIIFNYYIIPNKIILYNIESNFIFIFSISLQRYQNLN